MFCLWQGISKYNAQAAQLGKIKHKKESGGYIIRVDELAWIFMKQLQWHSDIDTLVVCWLVNQHSKLFKMLALNCELPKCLMGLGVYINMYTALWQLISILLDTRPTRRELYAFKNQKNVCCTWNNYYIGT